MRRSQGDGRCIPGRQFQTRLAKEQVVELGSGADRDKHGLRISDGIGGRGCGTHATVGGEGNTVGGEGNAVSGDVEPAHCETLCEARGHGQAHGAEANNGNVGGHD